MSENVTTIRGELEALERRRGELTAQAEGVAGELEVAQSDLIDRKDGAGETTTRLQASLTATQGAVKTLGDRIEAKHQELARAEQAAHRAVVLEQMAAIAQEAQEARRIYAETAKEYVKQFEAALEVLIESSGDWRNALRAFERLAGDFEADQLAAEMKKRGADTSAITARNILEEPLGSPWSVAMKAIHEGGFLREQERRRRPEPARA